MDGWSKVDGSALYVDDLSVPGCWHGVTVRSVVARARILEVDTSALGGDPNVVVLTARDLPGPNFLHLIEDDWRVLAEGEIEHHGEPIALVAAPTRASALEAARRIVVRTEPLPAITTLDEALELHAPLLAECALNHGDVDEGFREADFVVEGTYRTGHQEHLYIETQGALAIPHQDGGVEIFGSLQCPFYVHKALVPLLQLPPERVRVVATAVGGGFGGKEDFPDVVAAHAALLARAARHPVKLIYDRHEDLVATTKRHPSLVRHRSAVKRDGTLLAMDIDVTLDGGAYTTLSPVVLSRGVLHAGGPYRCPNVRVRGRVVKTNTVPNGAFRGFGAPQTQFAMERHLDRIARSLGLDPLSIRERNVYVPMDVTPTGQVLHSSVSGRECLEEAERRTRFREVWRAYEAERLRRDPLDASPLRGIGLSLAWHGTGFTGNGERRMRSPVKLRLRSGPRLDVLVAATDFGQGTSTVLAQIVAESAGLTASSVCVVNPDTAVVPDSGPTVASRTVMIIGRALSIAAARISRQIAGFAAAARGLPEASVHLRNGIVRTILGQELGTFQEWADALLATRGELEVEERYEPLGGESFDEATYRGTAYPAYGWICNVVEVTVDPDTLVAQPTHATAVTDVGRAIHPTLCKGQIEGGVLQALAFGYLEEIQHVEGRVRNDRLTTCLIPTAKDAPEMTTILVENPAESGPFGAKGVGELPMDAGAAAVVAALENATGITVDSLPATPEKLLLARERGQIVGVGAPPERRTP